VITKRIKIFVTSRPQVRVDSYFPDVIKLSLETKNGEDISDYVHSSVEKLEQRKFPIGIREDIQKVLIKESNGMFLWVYLILYELQTSEDSSEFNIRNKLKSLPKSIPDLYNRILGDIKVDNAEAAKNILRWVVWAERPLTLQELTIAIAIRPKQHSTSEMSKMMRFDLEGDHHSILGPLINIRNGLVYLVHQSAKDYLKVMDPITSEKITVRSNESNLYISTCCLAYLSFDEFEQELVIYSMLFPWREIRGRYKEFAFLEYSAMQWPSHVRQLDEELLATPHLLSVFLNLATSNKKFHSWHQVYRESNVSVHNYTHPWRIAAHFGFSYFLRALSDNWAAINDRFHTVGSPLLMAVIDGNKAVVRYLVEHGADVNSQGGEYRSPLQAAAIENHVEIVRYLVEHGADVNAQGGFYGNSLQAAATENRIDIVRYMVEHGADANAQGSFYGNSLQAASYWGHKIIVRYLVEHGADANAQGGEYGNPLQAAATENHVEIVRYPVENGADVNAQGGQYGNPLQAASYWGHKIIVRYLVEHGADVKAQGGFYANPLEAATENAEIVRYLVEHGADVNAQGGKFGNPLQAAATKNRVEIVRYLVENGADVNALSTAEANGKNSIVRFLLEKGASRNTKDSS
jgi:ankyrin repeat protein